MKSESTSRSSLAPRPSWGTDSIRGAKEIIITEGAPDWVSAVDHGFAAISPVTTNFREEDFEKLAQVTAHADAVYIINDNEDNEAGLKGALKTGKVPHIARAERSFWLSCHDRMASKKST